MLLFIIIIVIPLYHCNLFFFASPRISVLFGREEMTVK